jgi:3-oxoacid CoA-transferase subunit A
LIFLTGDTHRDFGRIFDFCEKMKTTKEDILIILGDAGINWVDKNKDNKRKRNLQENLPITLFCIHGNHENRPTNIPTYKEVPFHRGIAYIEEEYPNIIFAKDGEIYDFNNKKCLVIGGAYSVDKGYRLALFEKDKLRHPRNAVCS